MTAARPRVYLASDPSGRPMEGDDEEGRLLLALAKDAFRKQIAKRVRPLARGYVERWMACELWLYPSVSRSKPSERRSGSKSRGSAVVRIRTGDHPVNSRGLYQTELRRLASR